MLRFITESSAETQALGEYLGRKLPEGAVLCLQGDLGAGKTLLTKGIAVGLGVADSVTSPTFTILNIYEGNKNLYHFDLYRLEEQQELADIGFEEYVAGEGVTVIEWPDRFIACLPSDYLWLQITAAPGNSDEEKRIFQLEVHGKHLQSWLEELKKDADSCFRYNNPGI